MAKKKEDTSQPAEQKAGRKLLVSRTHPEYNEASKRWDFFLESYEGGETYINKHLFKYFKEGEQEYKDRVARASRENHSAKVVDLLNSYIFKEQPTRDTTNAMFKKFLDENADGKGHALSFVMRRISAMSSALGRVYVVMDKRQIPEEERTGTAKDNLSEMPYIYEVMPQDVMDISFDDAGGIRWIIIREKTRDDEDPFSSNGDVKTQYRLWLPDEWVLFDDAGLEIDAGDTGLGLVPVVIIDNEQGRSAYDGQSTIADIAYLDRTIFNNWSRLDTIVCDQTFSQLVMPIEGFPQDILTNKELREQFLTMATNRVLLFSSQAGMAPGFISPDASQAQFILEMVSKQVEQLYAGVGAQGETATNVKAQSGVAKAYDFDKLNKVLANKADNLEQAERDLARVFSKWIGAEVKYEVDYPEDFDVKTLADEIEYAVELSTLSMGKTFEAEMKKSLAQKAMPKLPPETLKKIEKEIEDAAEQNEEIAFANAMNLTKPPAEGEETGEEDTQPPPQPPGKTSGKPTPSQKPKAA